MAALEEKDRLCSLCGKNIATTNDHVPPKSIFPSPRPNDLITVPACLPCNKSTEKADEKFRVYLNLSIGDDTNETKTLWQKHSLSTLKHNPKIARKILTSVMDLYLKSKGGIIIGKAKGFGWPIEEHNLIIEKIIRGLYYHHHKNILGDRVTIIMEHLNFIPEDTLNKTQTWPTVSVANGQFIYRYGIAHDEPLYSVWLFQFHKKFYAWGYSKPINNISNPSVGK